MHQTNEQVPAGALDATLPVVDDEDEYSAEDYDKDAAKQAFADYIQDENLLGAVSEIWEMPGLGVIFELDEWLEYAGVTPEILAELIPEYWMRLEFPAERFGYEWHVDLFLRAGFVTDTPGVTRPDATITVYRGATLDYAEGMSWTLDRARAERFARRWRGLWGAERVYAAEVHPAFVLAILHGRNEQEGVVDPSGLQNVREVPFS